MTNNLEYTNFNIDRLGKQSIMIKQMIGNDFDGANKTMNELFDMTKCRKLPDCMNKLVVYGIIDIFMFYSVHSPLLKTSLSDLDMLFSHIIDGILECPDLTKVQQAFQERLDWLKDYFDENRTRTKMLEVMNYLLRNYADPDITLNSISEEFKLNNSYVSMMFKKEIGYNVLDFIHIARIERAKEMLVQTPMSITDISSRTGFYNYRTFCKVFKQYEKITPTEYRESKANFMAKRLNNPVRI